ncbi:polysaccharide biosynthesis tyrosine autokinase [soil metagenome]
MTLVDSSPLLVRDYLRIVRRRWLLVLVIIMLGVVAAYLTTPGDDREEIYTASHLLAVESLSGSAGGGRGGGGDNASVTEQASLDQAAFLVLEGAVPQRAAELLEFDGPPNDLAARVETRTDNTLSTLQIRTTNADPDRAELIADTFAEQLVAVLGEQASAEHAARLASLQARVDDLDSRISELDGRIAEGDDREVVVAQRDALIRQYGEVFEELDVARSEGPPSTGISTLQAAVAELADSEGLEAPTGQTVRMGIAALLGLLVGAAAAIAVDRFDTRIRTKREAEAAFGLPVVGEIPRAGRRRALRLVGQDHLPHVAEAYRMMRTPLLFRGVANLLRADGTPEGAEQANGHRVLAGDDRPLPTQLSSVLVTSCNAGEGKSSVVANLAVVLADGGRSVLAVDFDLRRPRLHVLFDRPASPGIADALLGGDPAQIGQVITTTGIPGVTLAPCGEASGDPAHIAAIGGPVLDVARTRADFTIVDSPPLRVVSDAGELVPSVDGVLVVCGVGKTRRSEAARFSEQLALSGAWLLGVVLVGTPRTLRSRSSYSHYRPHTAKAPRNVPLVEPVAHDPEPSVPERSEPDRAAVEDSAVEDSAVEDSAVEDSAVEDSAVEDSAVEDSAVEDSAVEDSAVEDSAVEDGELHGLSVRVGAGRRDRPDHPAGISPKPRVQRRQKRRGRR